MSSAITELFRQAPPAAPQPGRAFVGVQWQGERLGGVLTQRADESPEQFLQRCYEVLDEMSRLATEADERPETAEACRDQALALISGPEAGAG